MLGIHTHASVPLILETFDEECVLRFNAMNTYTQILKKKNGII